MDLEMAKRIMLDGEIDNVCKMCNITIGHVKQYGNVLGINELLKLYEECAIIVHIVKSLVANLSFIK